MNILTIQSAVVYGHVGNSASVFPLQRLGAEAWALNTVQFSNHPGYGSWTGQVFPGQAVGELVDGVAASVGLGAVDAVLSGYIGDLATGDAILRAAARVRHANPAALYACDPVIGDEGPGIYVRPGIAEHFRDRAVGAADILSPNHFELSLLAGRPTSTITEASAAVASLRARMREAGPRVVLVTSLRDAAAPADTIDVLAASDEGLFRVRTPRLPITVHGSGDMIAAMFLFHLLRSGDAAAALSEAASSVFGVIRRTHEAGARELLVVAAQEEIVAPSQRFTSERL